MLIDALNAAADDRYESIKDVDEQVSALIPFGLADALPLGNARPRWAAVQSWWDLDADRDLVLGSFLHGFSMYPKMRTDPRLCFASKVGGVSLHRPSHVDFRSCPACGQEEVGGSLVGLLAKVRLLS